MRNHCSSDSRAVIFTGFLGHWFGVLPLKLVNANLPLKFRDCLLPEPTNDEDEDCRSDLEEAALQHNAQIETMLKARYTLTSADDNNARGGICKASPDFASFVSNYFHEIVYDIVPNAPSTSIPENGEAHSHRTIRFDHGSYMKLKPLQCFLSPRDSILANIMENPKSVVSSIDTLMSHLTNRGHAAAPFIEGLTVELLPFQQESLQWAYERETMPGGIQTSVWSKLPLKGDQTVYFNPVLGMTSLQEPRLVRGGILAEQMGLGKTVISLALILKNPAPALPLSGAASTEISKDPDRSTSFWDPAFSSSDKAKGTILSRGTLVVVSLLTAEK